MAEEYTISDLGALSEDDSVGYIWNDVNDQGQVVGSYFDGSKERPVIWENDEVTYVTSTERSKANFISDDGSVAGEIRSLDNVSRKAVAWKKEESGFSEFQFSNPTNLKSLTRSISNNGIVVGDRYVAGDTNSEYEIFIAKPPLYEMISVFNESEYLDPFIAIQYPASVLVNNQETVIFSHGGRSIFEFTKVQNGNKQVVPDMYPVKLNNNGDVLGKMPNTESSELDTFPVILKSDGTVIRISDPQNRKINAIDMNDDRTVIGVTQAESTPEDFTIDPIIWKDGQVTDLNSLVPVDSGWTYLLPKKISNSGNIIGAGVLNGEVRNFLLQIQDECAESITKGGVFSRVDSIKCKLGTSWSMQDKSSEIGGNWTTKDGVIPPNLVNQKKFVSSVFVTNNGKPYVNCPTETYYKWTLKPVKKAGDKTEPKEIKLGSSCREPISLEEGKYKVSVVERFKADKKLTGRKIKNEDVIIQDWLIIGMGDSNGSGQGTVTDRIPYEFPQCDRNQYSYQAQVAKQIEEADSKTSVTFIHTACSGAQTVHINESKYLGQNPDENNKLPPQVDQVMKRLLKNKKEPRQVDAVILSIGVNDILFGPILGVCVPFAVGTNDIFYPGCQNFSVETTKDANKEGDLKLSSGSKAVNIDSAIRGKAAELVKLFKPVVKGLNTLGVKGKDIFHTSYPDFTQDVTGDVCGDSSSIGLRKGDWEWFGEMRRLLVEQIFKHQAKKNWAATPDFKEVFAKHGYCAGSQSWFQGLFLSIINQYTKNGGFHSKSEGHMAMADALFPHLCLALYGDLTCKGTPRGPKSCSLKDEKIVCK